MIYCLFDLCVYSSQLPFNMNAGESDLKQMRCLFEVQLDLLWFQSFDSERK